jgi:hypothetical protein
MSMENANLDFITRAEQRIQKELLSGDWFQGVQVLTNANGDLDAKILEAVAGLSMFIVITVSKGRVPLTGDIEAWECNLLITENPLMNEEGRARGKTARMAVQKIIAAAAESSCIVWMRAQEIVAENGVVWQLTGEVPVALPENVEL